MRSSEVTKYHNLDIVERLENIEEHLDTLVDITIYADFTEKYKFFIDNINNFTRKDNNETITGLWTFMRQPTFNGSLLVCENDLYYYTRKNKNEEITGQWQFINKKPYYFNEDTGLITPFVTKDEILTVTRYDSVEYISKHWYFNEVPEYIDKEGAKYSFLTELKLKEYTGKKEDAIIDGIWQFNNIPSYSDGHTSYPFLTTLATMDFVKKSDNVKVTGNWEFEQIPEYIDEGGHSHLFLTELSTDEYVKKGNPAEITGQWKFTNDNVPIFIKNGNEYPFLTEFSTQEFIKKSDNVTVSGIWNFTQMPAYIKDEKTYLFFTELEAKQFIEEYDYLEIGGLWVFLNERPKFLLDGNYYSFITEDLLESYTKRNKQEEITEPWTFTKPITGVVRQDSNAETPFPTDVVIYSQLENYLSGTKTSSEEMAVPTIPNFTNGAKTKNNLILGIPSEYYTYVAEALIAFGIGIAAGYYAWGGKVILRNNIIRPYLPGDTPLTYSSFCELNEEVGTGAAILNGPKYPNAINKLFVACAIEHFSSEQGIDNNIYTLAVGSSKPDEMREYNLLIRHVTPFTYNIYKTDQLRVASHRIVLGNEYFVSGPANLKPDESYPVCVIYDYRKQEGGAWEQKEYYENKIGIGYQYAKFLNTESIYNDYYSLTRYGVFVHRYPKVSPIRYETQLLPSGVREKLKVDIGRILISSTFVSAYGQGRFTHEALSFLDDPNNYTFNIDNSKPQSATISGSFGKVTWYDHFIDKDPTTYEFKGIDLSTTYTRSDYLFDADKTVDTSKSVDKPKYEESIVWQGWTNRLYNYINCKPSLFNKQEHEYDGLVQNFNISHIHDNGQHKSLKYTINNKLNRFIFGPVASPNIEISDIHSHTELIQDPEDINFDIYRIKDYTGHIIHHKFLSDPKEGENYDVADMSAVLVDACELKDPLTNKRKRVFNTHLSYFNNGKGKEGKHQTYKASFEALPAPKNGEINEDEAFKTFTSTAMEGMFKFLPYAQEINYSTNGMRLDYSLLPDPCNENIPIIKAYVYDNDICPEDKKSHLAISAGEVSIPQATDIPDFRTDVLTMPNSAVVAAGAIKEYNNAYFEPIKTLVHELAKMLPSQPHDKPEHYTAPIVKKISVEDLSEMTNTKQTVVYGWDNITIDDNQYPICGFSSSDKFIKGYVPGIDTNISSNTWVGPVINKSLNINTGAFSVNPVGDTYTLTTQSNIYVSPDVSTINGISNGTAVFNCAATTNILLNNNKFSIKQVTANGNEDIFTVGSETSNVLESSVTETKNILLLTNDKQDTYLADVSTKAATHKFVKDNVATRMLLNSTSRQYGQIHLTNSSQGMLSLLWGNSMFSINPVNYDHSSNVDAYCWFRVDDSVAKTSVAIVPETNNNAHGQCYFKGTGGEWIKMVSVKSINSIEIEDFTSEQYKQQHNENDDYDIYQVEGEPEPRKVRNENVVLIKQDINGEICYFWGVKDKNNKVHMINDPDKMALFDYKRKLYNTVKNVS